MDVRCERCNTEYEFDDALVSGRGTTVKCTNCGHKFKIRRGSNDFSEDYWNVQTKDGRTLVFTSLRELQRAIQTQLVERDDALSRGGLPPKAIGQIPELAPFFELGVRPETKTLPHIRSDSDPPELYAATLPAPPGASVSAPPAPPAQRQRSATRPDFPPPPSGALASPSSPPAAPGALGPPSVYSAVTTTLVGTGPDPEPSLRALREAPLTLPDIEEEPLSVREFTLSSSDLQSLPEVDAPDVGSARESNGGDVLSTQELERLSMREVDALSTQELVPLDPASLPELPEPAPPVSRPPPVPAAARPSSSRMTAPPASTANRPTNAPARPSGAASASSATTPSRRPPPVRSLAPKPLRETSSPLPPPTISVVDDDREELTEPGRRRSSYSLPDVPPSVGRRRSFGGVVVAGVVLAGMGLVFALWARNNLGTSLNASHPAPVATIDPKVAGLLSTGEKALAEGNLELAKESVDKASVLAEKDVHVLVAAARLAAVRADGVWLKARLLPADAADEQRITRDGLAEFGATARRASDDALAVAPDDPAVLRTKIDALRIGGEREAARALVARVASGGQQPETAYVLAALDLAEPSPLWSLVVERLRLAASAESGPGRARAALVYALARSGDVGAARTELERLAAMPRQHPLLPLLRAFTEHAKPAARDAGAPAASPAVAVGLAVGDGKGGSAPASAGGGGAPAGGAAPPSGDPRVLVAQGEAARAKGDYTRARALYSAAVEKNPNDSEALNGLATIAHAQRDLPAARTSYKRVLAINPSYLPALVGLADIDWESGDRANAMKTYKEVVDRFPEGTYPPRVKQRVEAPAPAAPAPGGATPAAGEDTGGGN